LQAPKRLKATSNGSIRLNIIRNLLRAGEYEPQLKKFREGGRLLLLWPEIC